MRRRLTKEKAEILGLKLKPNDKGRSTARYYLNKDQELQLKGITDGCESLGVDPSTVKHLWKKNKENSIFIKNPLFVDEVEKTFEDLHKVILEDIKKYKPNFVKIKRSKNKDGHLLIIDPADIHIGKLSQEFETGEDYNEQIAVKRVLEGVKGILEKAKGFNIDKILFIGGNDVLHIDSPKRETTAGTKQDTSGSWHSNFLVAKQMYIEVIELLLPIADVHFVFNPSNHDFMSGFFLCSIIETYFHNCKNISFDCDLKPRKYYAYGKNLIGSCHGDGAKINDLGAIMSIEAKHLWAFADHRYFFTHHVHHKSSKDGYGITYESLRSPSGTDAWHNKKGYGIGGIKAVEGYLCHPMHGQIARLTHIFKS